jgi:hypothetical protein
MQAMHIGQKKFRLSTSYPVSSLMAVICNGTTHLTDKETNLGEEFHHLLYNKHESHEKYGIVSYQQAKSQANQPDEIIQSRQSYNRMVKKSGNIDHHLTKSGFATEDFLNGKVLLACTQDSQTQTPYVFTDPLRDISYCMVADGVVGNSGLFMRLPGFIEWLDANCSEFLSSVNHDDAEYLFLWLIKCIQNCNHDVLAGLNKGLSMLNKYNIGGHFQLLFSNGAGLYAFSIMGGEAECQRKIAFKISRNIHNICSYTIRTCTETPGMGWTDIKEHNLYFFPTQGAMQVYANIDTNQYADSRFKTGLNWVCLSLLSC